MIDIHRLKEVLEFDPSINRFRWKVQKGNRVKIGDIAGFKNKVHSYIFVGIDEKEYREHHLIWLYHYGTWPKDQIDHINGIRDDNRLQNLREATNQQNQFNTKTRKDNKGTGIKNIYKSGKKYMVMCMISGTNHYLGTYSTIEEALCIRNEWYDSRHGKFNALINRY